MGFLKPDFPSDENIRLEKLKSIHILDTDSEEIFSDILALACEICETEMGAISLVDSDRQWFKAERNIGVRETPRDVSFCGHAIHSENLFVVPDASRDSRFDQNPLVASDPKIRFYAGAPLTMGGGSALGTLCVIDRSPKQLNPIQAQSLKLLSRILVGQLDARLKSMKLGQAIEIRKQMESDLSSARLRLQTLVDSMRSGVVVENADKRVVLANIAFLKIFGISSMDQVFLKSGTELLELCSQMFEEPRRFIENTSSIARSGIRIEGEELVTKDGRFFERDFIPMIVDDHYQGHLWDYREVTDRKAIDQLVEAQRSQLIESSKLAALGEMAGGIAHEINNPLAVIQGRMGILLHQAENGKVEPATVLDYGRKIISVVERISKIIRGLKAFARDTKDDPESLVSVSGIIEDTLEFCKERFQAHGVELVVGQVSRDLKILCRPVQIGQVLLNLLNNSHDAVRHLPSAQVRVEIRDDANYVELAVIDNGGGVPENIRKKIFEPFFTTKEVGHGTGMGLSISKGIIESHSGELSLRADVPHTEFVVRLPKRQEVV